MWQGCRFAITSAQNQNYLMDDGGAVTISNGPQDVPPPPPGCENRSPTQDEIVAVRAQVDALNARNRPPGPPPPPPHPDR